MIKIIITIFLIIAFILWASVKAASDADDQLEKWHNMQESKSPTKDEWKVM